MSSFVFTTYKTQSLYLLNPKFQSSSHLLWITERTHNLNIAVFRILVSVSRVMKTSVG